MGTTNAARWTREHQTVLRRIAFPPLIFGTIILTWQFWLGLLMAIHTAIAIDTFTANASGAVVSVRTITHRRKHGQRRYDMYPVFSFSDKDGNRHTVQSIIGETGSRDKSPHMGDRRRDRHLLRPDVPRPGLRRDERHEEVPQRQQVRRR